MSTRMSLCALVTLVAIAGSLVGCGEKQASEMKNKTFEGKWVQDPANAMETMGSANVERGRPTLLCHLDLNDDGTFRFTIRDADGKPLSPEQYAEGTWAIKGNSIHFNCSTRQLTNEHEYRDPDQSIKVGLRSRGADMDFLEVRAVNSQRFRYVRADAEGGGE